MKRPFGSANECTTTLSHTEPATASFFNTRGINKTREYVTQAAYSRGIRRDDWRARKRPNEIQDVAQSERDLNSSPN